MTLIELLVSIVIFSIILLTLTTISAFSYRNIIDASRRSDLLQEASFVVEHITKNVQMAIGSIVFVGIRTSGTNKIAVRWDRDYDGIPDDDASGDWIAYIYNSAPNEVKYYLTYDSTGWAASGGEVISSRISGFTLSQVAGTNYVSLTVTTCFDPDGIAPDGSSLPCGAKGNPSVTMSSNIDTPMISCR